jgi:hypothetical protein
VVNIRDEQPEPLVVPLSTDGSEHLTVDVGDISGWAAYHSAETQQRKIGVLLRFGPQTASPDAPIEIRELQISTRDGSVFHSPFLRTIPITRIVAAVNRPAIAEQLRELLPPANKTRDEFPGSGQWAYALPPREPVALLPELKVTDPGGRRKPDEFYSEFTKVYLEQASISDRPARDIAEANELPVTTVHRWLKEARNRGLLRLPASKGEE